MFSIVKCPIQFFFILGLILLTILMPLPGPGPRSPPGFPLVYRGVGLPGTLPPYVPGTLPLYVLPGTYIVFLVANYFPALIGMSYNLKGLFKI